MVGTVGEDILMDQQYSRFITDHTAFLREVPSDKLQKVGRRPKLPQKNGRHASAHQTSRVWSSRIPMFGNVFEALPIQNLTTRHKPQKMPTAGLSPTRPTPRPALTAPLSSAWEEVVSFTCCNALRQG